MFGRECRLKHETRNLEQKEMMSKWNKLNENEKEKYKKIREEELKTCRDEFAKYLPTKQYKRHLQREKQSFHLILAKRRKNIKNGTK